MFIIFGWENKSGLVRIAFREHCHRCQASRQWGHFQDSQWISFFFIPMIPIKHKHYLVCEGCNDTLELNAKAVKMLKRLAKTNDAETRNWIVQGFSSLIENHQLADKTEVQREYIRASRQNSDRDGD